MKKKIKCAVLGYEEGLVGQLADKIQYNVIFYLYPGSIFGCFIYNNCGIQPQLTGDFAGNSISSNHVYVFSIISMLGFISYSKKYRDGGAATIRKDDLRFIWSDGIR